MPLREDVLDKLAALITAAFAVIATLWIGRAAARAKDRA